MRVIDVRTAAPAALLAVLMFAGCGAGGTKTQATSRPNPQFPTTEVSLFPPPAPPPLSGLADGPVLGADLPVIVVNRTYSGDLDGQTYAEYYSADGTLRGRSGGERYSGTWAVVGDQLCFTYPESGSSEPLCYSVFKDGDVITWTGADGQSIQVNSVDGNPEGL